MIARSKVRFAHLLLFICKSKKLPNSKSLQYTQTVKIAFDPLHQALPDCNDISIEQSCNSCSYGYYDDRDISSYS
jgi:hypothetical protein